MNTIPFVLFVIPSTVDKKFIKTVTSDYKSQIVYSLKEMEECIFKNDDIHLIIIDNDLIHDQNNKLLVRWISTRKSIPVIMMINSNDYTVDAIEMKAIDFATKPIIAKVLKHQIDRIINTMRESEMNSKINMKINDELKETAKGLTELQAGIIGVISEIIEFRDFVTNSHNIRTQAYIEILIKKMIEVPNLYQREISLWDIQDHILSAQIHDIGKIIIPNEILTKPCNLTNAEYEVVKSHVVIGVNIIDKIIEKIGGNSYLTIARKYIESHHEHWNGNGYPYKLKENNIPLEGRILAIVDAYDVITNERPYKAAISHEDTVSLINKDSGIQFDPELIRIFNLAADQFKKLNQ